MVLDLVVLLLNYWIYFLLTPLRVYALVFITT
jgi:hypothetical protein